MADKLHGPHIETQPGLLVAYRLVKLGTDEFGGRLFESLRALRREQAGGSGGEPLVR